MPIYAYRCKDCGFEKDHLQKLSDAPIATCPSCGAGAYNKQVTAAGFQLKGSGWYATDFKGSSGKSAPATKSEGSETKSEGGGTKNEASAKTESSASSGCGTSCACH